MKRSWIFLYALLILSFPCFAFSASGSGPGAGSDSGTTDITGAKAAETMSPYAEGDRFRVTPDPYLPGSYRVTPLKPEDTGAGSAQAPGAGGSGAGKDTGTSGGGPGGVYRITPDPQVWGAYLATPEKTAPGSGSVPSGKGAAGPSTPGTTRAD